MMATKCARALALLGLTASSIGACQLEKQQFCTAIGCGWTHEASVSVASDAPGPLTIEACFNDVCGTALAMADRGGRISTSQEDVWMDAYPTETGVLDLRVSWYLGPQVQTAEGDRYAARVLDEDGNTLVESIEYAESYGRSYPNGKECDGEGCLHVESTTP